MKLNLNWYKEDINIYLDELDNKYRDEIEEAIRDTKKGGYFDENLGQNSSVYTFNNLSRIRENILRWMKIDKSSKFLEINSEFFTITKMLAEKCSEVTSISFSKRNLDSVKESLDKYDNLEVIVGSLKDIQLDKKYDYISVIGCAECTEKFFGRKPRRYVKIFENKAY